MQELLPKRPFRPICGSERLPLGSGSTLECLFAPFTAPKASSRLELSFEIVFCNMHYTGEPWLCSELAHDHVWIHCPIGPSPVFRFRLNYSTLLRPMPTLSSLRQPNELEPFSIGDADCKMFQMAERLFATKFTSITSVDLRIQVATGRS